MNFREEDPLKELSAALLKHPRFEAAALYYFDNVMEWRREIGFVNNLISSYSRNLVIAYVCFLYFANETGLPEGGATFSHIWQLVEKRKTCGSRALRTILGIMTLVGFLRKQPGEVDKRTYAYEPTDKLLGYYSKHLANTLRCFDILLDSDTISKNAAADERNLAFIMQSSGKAAIQYDISFAESEPKLLQLAEMSGGLATIYAISRAFIKKSTMPKFTEIAQKYKISANQARAVTEFAIGQGFFSLDANRNLVSAEIGTMLIKNLLARELALYAKFSLGLEKTLTAHIKS